MISFKIYLLMQFVLIVTGRNHFFISELKNHLFMNENEDFVVDNICKSKN